MRKENLKFARMLFGRVFAFLMGIIILLNVTISVHNKLKKQEVIENTYTSVLYIETGGNTYEVLVRDKDLATVYRENGVEKLITLVPRISLCRFARPSVTGVNTLVDKSPVSELTWKMSSIDSFRYITYLKEEKGYKEVFFVSTPTYVEVILDNQKDRKRFIVFSTSVMIGDLAKSAKLPSVDEYLKEYGVKKGE